MSTRILARLRTPAAIAGRQLEAGAVVEVDMATFRTLLAAGRAVPHSPQFTAPTAARIGPAARPTAAMVDLAAARRRALANAPARRPWPRRGE